jgi:hypothetical protein
MILYASKIACFDAGLLHVKASEVYQVPTSDVLISGRERTVASFPVLNKNDKSDVT